MSNEDFEYYAAKLSGISKSTLQDLKTPAGLAISIIGLSMPEEDFYRVLLRMLDLMKENIYTEMRDRIPLPKVTVDLSGVKPSKEENNE